MIAKQIEEPLLVSRKRAASLLGGVDVRTLDSMADRGELRPVRIGRRRVMYSVSDLRTFVEQAKAGR